MVPVTSRKVIKKEPTHTFTGDCMFWIQSKRAETPQTTPTPAYAQPQGRSAGTYANVGVLCAIVALFVMPEVFGTAAAVLGAYVWRLDCGQPRQRGAWVVVLGVVFMLVGIYYTSLYGLYDILP
jgi:hypothetical protein